MTLFVLTFFVIAALVLLSWLMVRPLADEPPASGRKRRPPSSELEDRATRGTEISALVDAEAATGETGSGMSYRVPLI
jgi:hypothetical protein